MSTWLLRIWSPCADLLPLHGHVMLDAFINALLRNLIGVMYACAIGRQVACRNIHISKKCEVMEQSHDIIPGIFFTSCIYVLFIFSGNVYSFHWSLLYKYSFCNAGNFIWRCTMYTLKWAICNYTRVWATKTGSSEEVHRNNKYHVGKKTAHKRSTVQNNCC